MARKPQNPADIAQVASKLGELKARLLFLIGALIVFRIGTFIPVPGVDPIALADFFEQQAGGLLGMVNLFSGGALSRFGIFAMGIMPYISSSIIMQMASHIVPSLQQLRKEGEQGRRQIIKYTRYGTVALASFQSIAAASWLQNQAGLVVNPGPAFLITACITLVTGTMFLMWLGEQITERGIGNGISLIIFAGIVAGLATMGYKVMQTIGTKITELTPTRGYCATLAAATTVVLASKTGLPVSTTHIAVGAVMGVGMTSGVAAVDLRVIRDIVASWLITLPAGAIMAILFFFTLKGIFGISCPPCH